MRLSLSLGLLLALSTSALADPVACHVTLQSTTHRLDHHVTSCHSNDDTKYDEKLDTSYQVRSGCTIQMDDGGINIDLDVPEPATGSMQSKQENEGVYGSNASGTTTISGKSSGGILLMKQPSGLLLPQGSLTFAAKSTGKEHIHDNCDPNKQDVDLPGASDLDALITPFPEVFMHQQDPAAFMTAPPTFKISREAFEKGFASHKPFTVTGSGSYAWHDDNGKADVHEDVTMVVEVGSIGYEAILEAVDDAGYDKWLPYGPDPGKVDKKPRGNSITFKAYLRDKKTKKPATGQAYTVRFKLLDVTHMPGVAMNFPRVADREYGPDMFFARDLNTGGSVPGAEADTLEFPKGSVERTAVVSARDYGAYARLQAEIEVDGTKLLATMNHAGKETSEATLPHDTNGNKIADDWETDRGIFQEPGIGGGGDDDARPAGMAKKGDGYTVYEEYRGFAVEEGGKLVHRRLDPTQRDLFVIARGDKSNDKRALIIQSAQQLGTITDIRVHVVTPDLVEKQPEAQYQGKYQSWTNFNATGDKAYFGPPEAAVSIVQDEGRNFGYAYTPSINPAWNDTWRSPRDIEAIYVSFKASVALVDGIVNEVPPKTPEAKMWKPYRDAFWKLNKDGIKVDPNDIAPLIKKRRDDIINQVFMFLTFHEMGHAIGAKHHADDELARFEGDIDYNDSDNMPKDQKELREKLRNDMIELTWGQGEESCPMRYWQVSSNTDALLLLALGRFQPLTSSPAGKPWHFCGDNWSTMRLNGQGDERKNAHPGN